jgi:hypothetical protein
MPESSLESESERLPNAKKEIEVPHLLDLRRASGLYREVRRI